MDGTVISLGSLVDTQAAIPLRADDAARVSGPIRVALVGCGAVAELRHAPALYRSRDFVVSAICDRSVERARMMARFFPAAKILSDFREAPKFCEAAVVAVPNSLHAQIGAELLANKIHVLIEKPLAVTSAECDVLARAALENDVTLSAGLNRRFYDSTALVKSILHSGVLGEIRTVDLQDGGKFEWPAASDALFRKDLSGGGVLIDAGVHIIDALLHWLGPVESARYFDDAAGGVEAECRLELAMLSGVRCNLEFSRIRAMRGTYQIRGSLGSLEVSSVDANARLDLRLNGWDGSIAGVAVGTGTAHVRTSADAFDAQLKDFARAIRSGAHPLVDIGEGRKSVELIESCYRSRLELERPWSALRPGNKQTQDARRALEGKTILVLGGTGFIGSRLVEDLVAACAAQVRVLVRDFGHAARIARYPVKMIPGDVRNAEDVRRAAEGCDVIIHAAYGLYDRESTVDGTRNVLEAARSANAARVVYLSTLDVYGIPSDVTLDESAPRKRTGRFYGDTKIEAEALADRAIEDGLPVVILQPTIVYGPFAPFWTVGALNAILEGRLALVDGGGGLCNAVYIDDMIQAILLAAVEPGAVGKTFLISGDRPIPWSQYSGALAGMAGRQLPNRTGEELIARHRSQRHQEKLLPRLRARMSEDAVLREMVRTSVEVRGAVGKLKDVLPKAVWRTSWKAMKKATIGAEPLPGAFEPAHRDMVDGMSPEMVRYNRAKMTVSIDKAKNELRYEPGWTFQDGMNVTEQWARWANLL